MRATSGTGSRGFTLIELLVVLTIIVLLAASWPLASERIFAAQRVRNEALKLASALQLGRMNARMTGIQQPLVISADGTTYAIGTESHALPQGMELQLNSQSPDGLIMYPDGTATPADLELRQADRRAVLKVWPVTARIELQI